MLPKDLTGGDLDNLLALLDDDDWQVVEQAVQRLIRHPDRRAVKPLARLLGRTRTDFRLHQRLAGLIASALDEIHDPAAIPHLLEEIRFLRKNELVSSDAWETTWHFLEGFADLGVENFAAELSVPDPLYRIEVVYALGNFFEAQAEDILIAALADPDAEVQETVAEVLAWNIKTPKALAAVESWHHQRGTPPARTN